VKLTLTKKEKNVSGLLHAIISNSDFLERQKHQLNTHTKKLVKWFHLHNFMMY